MAATVHPLSLGARAMVPHYRGHALEVISSGFLWVHKKSLYYIIALHSLTGRNTDTGKTISKTGVWPDRIDIHITKDGKSASVRQSLYADNRPVWLVHPDKSLKCDIAALEITVGSIEQIPLLKTVAVPLNRDKFDRDLPQVGEDVFILGFPFKELQDCPIWKRGSVASEPEYAAETSKYILVDTASLSGMSGAPVIRMRTFKFGPDGQIMVANGRPIPDFVGVYSGRMFAEEKLPPGKKPRETQLARVWPANYLDEILNSKTIDTETEPPHMPVHPLADPVQIPET